MKQLLQNLRSGETVVADVPIPNPQTGEVLVRTAFSLVSAGTERTLVSFAEKSLVGKARSRPDLVRQVLDKARREGALTTLEAAFNRLDQPMPLGYSSAGTVVGLGAGVQKVRIGERVACAGGGYAVHAEYATVPANLVASLPEPVRFETAAFTTLGAIALHGFRLAEAQIGSRVAVIGLGLLGLLTVAIARAAGCAVLGVDLDPDRVTLGKLYGAEAVLRPEAEAAGQAFSHGRGCDAVIICADARSDDPVELAGVLARDRARVVATGVVGLNLPNKTYYEKELTFMKSRSYGPGRYDPVYEEAGQDYPIGYVRWTEGRNLEAFVELLADRRVDVQPLISHRFSIDQAGQAYELITGKTSTPFLGVLLTYPGSSDKAEEATGEPVQSLKIPPPAIQTSVPGKESVHLGVLGAGNFANAVLLPAISKVDGIDRVAIGSASGTSAHHAARRFGFKIAVSDESSVLNNPEVNTVAILTRHHLHTRQALAALAAGKHVFCEKPLAIDDASLDEVAKCLRTIAATLSADDQKPLLMVGFNRRFAPLAVRLKAFLEGRKEPLAMTYRVNAGFIPPTHWLQDPAQGGGRIVGEGCHFIDFLTFLVGSPPVSVRASGLPDIGRYREDNVLLTLGFPDGSLGTILYISNGDKAFPKERVEVFCAGKAAVLDDFRSLELVANGKREVEHSRLRQDKGHRAEWTAFARVIANLEPAPIPYTHLIGVTRASLRAVDALRSGEELQI
jgi:predicted dehydrogenase/threonine dehydrogenase-like Zn-dependent dehydrogenase